MLAQAVTDQLAEPAVGVQASSRPQTVVIDYSAPNVAKQMHVGHLRTTIIGDCFNRVLTAVGHRVLPQNHIGDWGTQFGMLVEYVLDAGVDASQLTLPEAEDLYKRGSLRFREDPEFAERARRRVVALQSGDDETRAIWRQLIEISLAGFNATYDRLNVLLTDDHLAGESTYNDDLASVAAELEASGSSVCRAPWCTSRVSRDGPAALPSAPLDRETSGAALDAHQAGGAGIGGFGANGVLGFRPGHVVQQPTARRDGIEGFAIRLRDRGEIDQPMLELHHLAVGAVAAGDGQQGCAGGHIHIRCQAGVSDHGLASQQLVGVGAAATFDFCRDVPDLEYGKLDRTLRHEAAAAAPAHDEAIGSQCGQRAVDRHARSLEGLGEFHLGGNAPPRPPAAGDDGRGDGAADLLVDRAGAGTGESAGHVSCPPADRAWRR